MAIAGENINDIIGPEAFAQLKKVLTELDNVARKIADVSSRKVTIEADLKGATSLKDVVATQQQLVNVQGELITTTGRYKQVFADVAVLQSQYNGTTERQISLASQYIRTQAEQESLSLKSTQAELARAKLRKAAIDEQIAAFRLQQLEEKKAAVERAAADKLEMERMQQKIAAEKEYVALWQGLLAQRDQQEGDRAKVTAQPYESAVGASNQLSGAEAQDRLTAMQEQERAQAQAAAAIRGTTVATEEQIAAEKQQLTALQENIQELIILKQQLTQTQAAIKENGGATVELAEKEILLKTEIADLNRVIAAQAKDQISQETSVDSWRAKVSELTAERNKLNLTTQEGAVRQKELNAQIDEYNALIRQNVDKYQQQKINIGNYPTLTAELTAVKQQMQQLVIAGEENSAEFQALAGRSQELTAAMAKVNAVAKESVLAQEEEAAATKTAGQAIQEKAAKAVSLENVAGRLITSFTRMGIHFLAFTVIFKGIEWVIEKMGLFESKTSATAKALKKYDDSLKSIEESEAGAAQQEIAHLNVLTKVAADTTESMKNRLRAVQELQKTYPDRFGALTKEAILEGNVADAIRRTTDELLNRASAQAAEKKIAAAGEKRYDLILQQRKAQEDLNLATQHFQDLNDAAGKGTTNQYARNATVRAVTEMERLKGVITDVTAKIADSDKEIAGFGKDAAAFAAKAGQTLFSPDPKPKKVKAPGSLASADEGLDRNIDTQLAEEAKKRIQANQDAQRQIIEDDKKSLDERAAAVVKFWDMQDQISDIELAKAKKINADELAAITRKEDEARKAKKLTAAVEDNLNKQRQLSNAKLGDAQAQYTVDGQNAAKAAAKSLEQIQKDQVTKSLSAVSDLRAGVEKSKDQELRDLEDKEKRGAITFAQFKKEEKEVSDRYAKLEEQTVATYLNKQLDDLEAQGVDVTELRKSLNEALKKLYNADYKEWYDKEQKKADLTKRTHEAEKQLAGEVINAVQSIVDASFEKRMQQEQDLIDAIGKRRDAEVEAVNTSLLSEDEKQKRIAAINARAAAQEAQEQARLREYKRKQAIADKAASVVRIVENTAIAVADAFAEFGPVAGIPLAAIVGAIGAAQIATVLAQPIPQYATGIYGDESHPGGWAVLGDAGRQEPYLLPSGQMGMSPAQPTLMNLPAGTQVFPSAEELVRISYALTMQAARAPQAGNQGQLTNEEMVGELKSIRKAIERQQPVVLTGHSSKFDQYIYFNTKR